MLTIAGFAALLAVVGLAQGLLGYGLVRRFKRRRTVAALAMPAVTILKPLFGTEPLLEQALMSLCEQDYPCFQIVFGVQDPLDPAIAVVRLLQRRFADRDIVLVVDATVHGRNRKVGNLINMLPAARHDVLVIADSDVHVRPDYLRCLVAALEQPGAGLVTTLYTGLPGTSSVVGELGATAITHGFLPGALIARVLGREDCLGATMMLRRQTLGKVGGFRAIADDLADDAALGRAVRRLGLRVVLADTVPATTVPETRLAPLFWHELRWARVICVQVPAPYALSVIQYPLAWALLCVPLSDGAGWSAALLAITWIGRVLTGRGIDRALGLIEPGLARPVPIVLLPLRDLMSVAVLSSSYFSDRVRWRGQVLNVRVMPPDMIRIDAMTLGTERS